MTTQTITKCDICNQETKYSEGWTEITHFETLFGTKKQEKKEITLCNNCRHNLDEIGLSGLKNALKQQAEIDRLEVESRIYKNRLDQIFSSLETIKQELKEEEEQISK